MKKKGLFSIGIKLSYYKVFHRKSVDCKDKIKKNWNKHKLTCLLRFINIRIE